VRRWHANNGRGMATITNAVENGGTVRGITHRQSRPAPSRGFRYSGGPAPLALSHLPSTTLTSIAARHARRAAVSFVAKNTGFGSQPTKGCPQLAPQVIALQRRSVRCALPLRQT